MFGPGQFHLNRGSFILVGSVYFLTQLRPFSGLNLFLDIIDPSLRSQNYRSLNDNKQDRRISSTSGLSGQPRIATLSNRPSTSGYSTGQPNSVQSQTLTQTIPRVSMTCTTPPDQRSHNPGPSGTSHLQPGPSGRGGNGRVANLMNMQSQPESNLSNLRTMMGSGPVHPGPGLSGQNMNPYNQNVFSQQCPPLVNNA